MKTLEKNGKVVNEVLVDKLNGLFADYQLFYQNLRGLHWNVKGNQFFALREKYESYYNEAAEVVNKLVERILMVGGEPVHAYSEYLKRSEIEEVQHISNGTSGLKVVLANSEYLLKKFFELLNTASDSSDEGTVALMSDLISSTEKRIWMLKATLS